MIIGIGSSKEANIEEKAEKQREKKLQNPNAVALNSVGNKGACATYMMLKANEIPSLAANTRRTKTKESSFARPYVRSMNPATVADIYVPTRLTLIPTL